MNEPTPEGGLPPTQETPPQQAAAQPPQNPETSSIAACKPPWADDSEVDYAYGYHHLGY